MISPTYVKEEILKCQTWTAVEATLDAAGRLVSKDRATVYRHVIRLISLSDRQHLVRLLAEHMQQFPRDYWAYTWLPSSSRKLTEKARAMSGISQVSNANTDEESVAPDYLEPIEEE